MSENQSSTRPFLYRFFRFSFKTKVPKHLSPWYISRHCAKNILLSSFKQYSQYISQHSLWNLKKRFLQLGHPVNRLTGLPLQATRNTSRKWWTRHIFENPEPISSLSTIIHHIFTSLSMEKSTKWAENSNTLVSPK